MPPDIVHPAANLESLVASDQRNDDGKEGSLGDPDEQVPDRDGFFLFPADPESNNIRVYVLSAATAEIKAGPAAEELARKALSGKKRP